MASPQPAAILTFHAAFYLPVVLFALLAALVAPFALPSAPIFSAAASEFAPLAPLYQLWSSFLSWFTPPCLFVILNGIIVTLSATSGMLSSSSASAAASSDFCPKLLSKVPSHLKQILDDPVEIPTYRVSSVTNLSTMMQEHSVHNLSVKVSSISTNESRVVLDAPGAFQEEELQFYDAEDEAHTSSKVDYSHGFSRPGLESRSVTFCCRNHILGEEEEEGDDEHECNNNDMDEDHWNGNERDDEDEHGNGNERNDEDANQDLMEKRVSLAYMEETEIVQMTSRSVPSSPRFATPPKPNSIKRSLSVGSAPYPTDQAATDFVSAESLSDEAFRKRVEDFISRMNAQLRKEVK